MGSWWLRVRRRETAPAPKYRGRCHEVIPDTDEVIAELEKNGSLIPALNWYRANVPPAALVEPPLELLPVAAPTMGVWSSGDFALTEKQMTGSAAHVAGQWRYERIEGPGHWMQLEAPDAIKRLLVDFLSGCSGPRAAAGGVACRRGAAGPHRPRCRPPLRHP